MDLGGGGGGGEGGGSDFEVGGGEDGFGFGFGGESTLVELGGGVSESSNCAGDSSPAVAVGEGPELGVVVLSACKGRDSFDEEPGGGFPTEFNIVLVLIYIFLFLSNPMDFHNFIMVIKQDPSYFPLCVHACMRRESMRQSN